MHAVPNDTLDDAARPVLALLVALARDPLLRSTQEFVRAKHMGDAVLRDDLVALLAANHRDRFSPASLISFAQNVNGTWTQAGFLAGIEPSAIAVGQLAVAAFHRQEFQDVAYYEPFYLKEVYTTTPRQ